MKFNTIGNISWQRPLGGTAHDGFGSLAQTYDSGYVVAGYTSSLNGDVLGLKSGWSHDDAWIIKLSILGDLQYQKIIGGSDDEYAQSILPTDDSGFIVACSTYSNDKSVSANHGSNDIWVVKINTDTTDYSLKVVNHIFSKENINIFPTVTNGKVNVELPPGYENAQFKLTNYLGKSIEFKIEGNSLNRTICIPHLSDGLYLLQIVNETVVQVFRIYKQS